MLKGGAANDKAVRVPVNPLPFSSDQQKMEGKDMQKSIPVLKILLIASIGIIVFAIAANLVVGSTSSALQMMFPLIGGLFAYGVLTNMNLAAPKCPTCATQQPVWRKPTSLRQTLLDGWTCTNCGTEMDRNGKAINGQNNRHA